ncbi:unnamed protein product [Kuraishia capsulata CBS 1993]|uniref:Major facilitator superfamily (MFS) profile domain-containing protein n=1 Tax=Kuraishia capsulata CBS 1993 TaxID=1382522 RepID=W6MM17_9ASCO|nr:uncharacterized protein KUCA_T00001913001 [Kuraishia capsulata CBS 1993]CDK25942.1 unnamed protein product [Kuraishia capsulata CBS 1993]
MTSKSTLPLYNNSSNRYEDSDSVLTPVSKSASPRESTPHSAYEQSSSSQMDKHVKSSNLPRIDRPRFMLLVLLYLLQGVPVGLGFGSVPFLLKSGQLSYSQVGIFTLASYPYSLKLLWAPVVDSFYSKRLGRRRSWIIPVQLLSSIVLITIGSKIDFLLEDLFANLQKLTVVFFLLILLCATQDIAVDGWALTSMSPSALSYASTAQTIGLNTGYFMSFTVFLAFNSPDFANKYLRPTPLDAGVMTLGQYMKFWGFVYFVVTIGLLFISEDPNHLVQQDKKYEDIEMVELERDIASVGNTVHAHSEVGNVNTESLTGVYKKMIAILRLPNVRAFVILHLISKIGFQANEGATNLKLLEKGFSKEDLAITVLIDFPFEIIFGYYAGRWSTGAGPLNPWLYAYLGRIAAACLSQFMVWCFPSDGKVTSAYFLSVILSHLLGSFMSTIQFVSICAFHTQIADPAIGGTYMTTLNTLSNLGGQWPRLVVFYLIDKLTRATCLPSESAITSPAINNPFVGEKYYHCVNAKLKTECVSNGGVCHVEHDGYMRTNLICIAIGLALYFYVIKGLVMRLQSLPPSAWRLKK